MRDKPRPTQGNAATMAAAAAAATTEPRPPYLCVIALVGAPNAGKSTLFNRLTGRDLAPVCARAQTTRARLVGLVRRDEDPGPAAWAFIDTPGLMDYRQLRKKHLSTPLHQAMSRVAREQIAASDLIWLVVDARRPALSPALQPEWVENRPLWVVFNKTDTLDETGRGKLASYLADLEKKLSQQQLQIRRTVAVSAKTGHNTDQLWAGLSQESPQESSDDSSSFGKSPHMHMAPGRASLPLADETALVDTVLAGTPDAFIATELTRGVLLGRLRREIPYCLTVRPSTWAELADGSLRIAQVLELQSSHHRKIVLGKRGHMIRTLSIEARQALERAFERRVHLFLTIEVNPDWSIDPSLFRHLSGYSSPSSPSSTSVSASSEAASRLASRGPSRAASRSGQKKNPGKNTGGHGGPPRPRGRNPSRSSKTSSKTGRV